MKSNLLLMLTLLFLSGCMSSSKKVFHDSTRSIEQVYKDKGRGCSLTTVVLKNKTAFSQFADIDGVKNFVAPFSKLKFKVKVKFNDKEKRIMPSYVVQSDAFGRNKHGKGTTILLPCDETTFYYE